MKKEMKMLSILGMVVLTAAAVPCKKGGEDASPAGNVAFRAVADDNSAVAKTDMVGTTVRWATGDNIAVASSKLNWQSSTFELTSGENTSRGEFKEIETVPDCKRTYLNPLESFLNQNLYNPHKYRKLEYFVL